MINSSKMPAANGKISVAPSILSADLWNLGEAVKQVETGGADWLHIDIMDGHFVPNLSFGSSVVSALNRKTDLPLDVHLMVEEPLLFIDSFAKAGADLLTVHIEAKDDIAEALELIKKAGVKTGVSIKPNTDPGLLEPLVEELDLILVMSVYPGFGGQHFLPESEEQIKRVREIIKRSGRKIWLEVDGGINPQTAPLAVQAGADALVAGSAIFKAADPVLALKQIRQAAPEI